MSRGAVDGLRSAHPLADLLPAVYLEDDFARGFTEGLDPGLAPVFLTLDCLEAYVDPRLTPLDFLPWLAAWVGLDVDETLPEPRRRAVVAEWARLHHRHGTRAGLVRLLEVATGGQVEVRESGGARWSAVPGADPPGDPVPGLHIVVRVPRPSDLDQARVERLVREVRPAHVPFRVEVLPAR
jgi:phage tail-like protein